MKKGRSGEGSAVHSLPEPPSRFGCVPVRMAKQVAVRRASGPVLVEGQEELNKYIGQFAQSTRAVRSYPSKT